VRVFEPIPDESSQLAHPADPKDFETVIVSIDGTPRAPSWHPIDFVIVAADEGKRLREVDMPWLGSHALIVTRRALDALSSIVCGHAESLPLASQPPLWILNPTNVLDALDVANSDVVRFSSGRIMRVRRYAFRDGLVGALPIFKITGLRASPTFVSDAFVEEYRAAGLTGLVFKQVWEDR